MQGFFFTGSIVVIGLGLAGCASNLMEAPGGKYKEPASDDIAYIYVRNQSNFAANVGIYESIDCVGQSQVYYSTDRDDEQKAGVAGYKDGKPIYYRNVSTESAVLPTQRTLRNIVVRAKPTVLHLRASTPVSIEHRDANSGLMRWRQCDVRFVIRPERGQKLYIEFGSDEQIAQCTVSVSQINGDSLVHNAQNSLPIERAACGG
jgi:hypothetical protein